MNRLRYQLVFNRHRGQLMVVPELASGGQHPVRMMAVSPPVKATLPTALRFSLLTVTLAIALTTLAHAQILGDRNAPRNQQPTVLAAPNGVPVVNIQTPNRAGVSLNSYRQFDVGSNGVILNNAATTTNTQLGGYVAGNPWLATGVARTIVNQVNSPNPSYLRGYVEVAGSRAQVVIANPYGISCAGCGFINASRITLTTGTTQIVNGNLDSYRVVSGSVRIEGAGMDARQTDYAEIIARAVQLNAGIWANDLKVSTGLNTVSADHRSVLPGVAPSEPAPVVAIDVAQLGGMYAGHIILTATEHGVGVRNAGSIGASVGQAVVTVDGRLENSGSLTTNGLLAVQTTGGISNSGELGSKSAVSLTTSRLDNAGNINSAGNLAVQASDSVLNTGNIDGNAGAQISAASIDNRKTLGSGATLDLQAATTLSNSGTLQANGNTTLTAATLNNSGTISATQAALTINSSADSLNSGRIEAAQKLTLNAANLSNSGTFSAVQDMQVKATAAVRNTGAIGANQNIALQSATLDNSGTIGSSQAGLSLETSAALSNHGQIGAAQKLAVSAAGIDNSDGKLIANDLQIDTQGQLLDNRRGLIAAQREVRIASGDLDNTAGLLQSGNTLSINATDKTITNADSGNDRGILAQGDLSITAATLNNRGVVGTNGQLTIASDTVSNSNGALQARQGVDIQSGSGSVDNQNGLIRSDGAIKLQAATVRNDDTQGNNQGIEASSIQIAATDISNRKGAIRGDSVALTGSGRIDNTGGLMSATNSLSLSDSNTTNRTLSIDNSGGTLIAGQQTTLSAYTLNNGGSILSQKNLTLDLVASLLHTGQVAASGDIDFRIAGSFTNAGTVGAGGTLLLTAAGIDNQASGSLLGNTLRLKSTGLQSFNNRGLIDGVNTFIDSNTVNNIGTGRIYGDNIAIAAGTFNNRSETVNGVTSAAVVAARNRLDIGAGVINNSEHALLYSAGDMAIGGALDGNRQATGSAREVNNDSATINADGNLRLAATTLNNNNLHLETSDQTTPGNRIVSYRVNGSSTLIDGTQASLVNIGSGQVVGPMNWWQMGDEDNFRLVLPSTTYPVERYGPPFTYSKGAKATDSAVALAYIGEWQEGSSGGDSTIVVHPTVINYNLTDGIWKVMGVTPPAEDPGPAPVMPRATETCYESCTTTPPSPEEVARYQADYAAWKPKWDSYVAILEQLNSKIKAFNDDVSRRSYREWTIYDGTEKITRTVVTRSDPGMITSGGNMTLAVGSVNNNASQIIAGGTLAGDSVNGTAINNIGPVGQQRVVTTGSASYTYIKSHRKDPDDRRYDDAPYLSQEIVTNFQLDVAATNGSGPNRANTVRAIAPTVSAANGGNATNAVRIAAPDLTLPDNALYRIKTGPGQPYLVQTDPQFIGNRNWLSSDFMLKQLGGNGGMTSLGDGYYEQQLIQRQIQQITGQRYLTGYSNNEAQYQALMNAGLKEAQARHYTVGVALTDAQIAELQTDIVWLVKQTVTLADGSRQEVLVPQVYVHVGNVEVTGQGTLIAANNIAFQTAQDIVNRGGTIAGRQSVSLAGNNIQNLGGRISGGTVGLSASTDINNTGGTIDARNTLVVQAGRDINSSSTTVATANAVTSGTNINQAGSLSVSGDNGSLAAIAGRDINLQASSTSAANITLAAQRDVNLSTVHETSQEKITWDSKNRAEVSRDNAVGSNVHGTNISVTAGRDINAQAAYVDAAGALNATAGNNLNLGTDVSTASARDQHKKSDSAGALASRTVTTDDSSSQRINQGTTFSGNTVAVRAGNDINVTGSNVVSTQGTTVAAGNNVNIVAAVDSSTQHHFREEKTSGVMGSGAGVTIGTRQQSHDVNAQGQTAAASTVGSTDGNVSISAGNRYTQVGSDVLAPKGDIDIAAKSVEIRAAEQAGKTVVEDKVKQVGLTIAISSPVLSAIQTVDQMVDAASKTKDARMQALAGATAGLAMSNAADAIKSGQGQTIDGRDNQIATGAKDPITGKTPSRDATAADKIGGINLALSVGGSSSQSHTELTSNTIRGSKVSAGGNVNITAQGGGSDSNITIQGSDIQAGVNTTLKAANEVRLIAAQESSSQQSSNKSTSGSIGASVGSSGLVFTASASGSRGGSDGTDITQVNTHVNAGNKLTISSGTDTTLKGAVVSGKQVVMDVGTSGSGNLNIESLQDTSTYKSNQQSLGGSVSAGMGQMSGSVNYSKSSSNSNYASVTEQSGIKAGDGGFQINVRGNTDLKGAVIASSDKAVTDNKNSLTTATLTQSDIKNTAEYTAQSVGIGVGYSTGKSNPIGRDQQGNAQTGGARVPGADLPTTGKDGGMSATSPVIMGASGSSSSVTRSGVSGGAISITDDKKQQALTGKTGEQTVASLNRDVSSDKDGSNALKPIFDKQDIDNRFAIVGAFTREVGGFLENRAKESTEALKELDKELAKPKEQQDVTRLGKLEDTLRDNEKWEMGGTGRLVLTAVSGGVTGNVAGSTESFLKSAAAYYFQGLATQEVKGIADLLDSDSARAALQGLVACVGAATQNQGCGAGAAGAAASVVLNNLLNGLIGETASSLSQEEKQSRKNLVASIVAGTSAVVGGDVATATLASIIESENNATAFVKGTTERIKGAATSTADMLRKPKGSVTRQEVEAELAKLKVLVDSDNLSPQESLNLSSLWMAVIERAAVENLMTTQEVIGSKQFLQAAITAMAFGGSGNTSVRISGGSTGPRLQTTSGNRTAVELGEGGGLIPSRNGANNVKTGGTVELFTDASGPKVPGAVGVGPTDPTAIATNATNMPNIPSGSQAVVVANNPYIPKAAGGTFSMMDYLPEASRITQPGGKIIINGNAANKYFTNMPTSTQLDAMGLTVEYQGPILPEYQGMIFKTTQGKPIEPSTMQTIVFVKKGGQQ